MKKKTVITFLVAASISITACGGSKNPIDSSAPTEMKTTVAATVPVTLPSEAPAVTEAPADIALQTTQVDWSEYFHGMNGAAVVFLPDENKYMIYNEELSSMQRSPCSTFKIISSLTGLEEGVIADADTVRTWSGETFWNEKWNRDIGFRDAFQSSCIWYFREVIDELGPEVTQRYLDALRYGNGDISDWNGKLNNNNSNPALTGFWVESSLKISAREQTEVMARIFCEDSPYREGTLAVLKDAMLITDADAGDRKIYGKTGMGKSHGVTVDAWYTGFVDTGRGNAYFCVYIGQSDGMDVTSADAKSIALKIIENESL